MEKIAQLGKIYEEARMSDESSVEEQRRYYFAIGEVYRGSSTSRRSKMQLRILNPIKFDANDCEGYIKNKYDCKFDKMVEFNEGRKWK